MQTPDVYKTSKPEVVALWDKWMAAEKRYRAAIRKFLRDHGFKPRRGQPFDKANERDAMVSSAMGGVRLAGVTHSYNQEIPEGWRHDRQHGHLVPRRGSKEGKVIAAEMDAIRAPDFVHDIAQYGCPPFEMMVLGGQMYMVHPAVEKHGKSLFVVWKGKLQPTTEGKPRMDPEIWKPVPLSAYYKMREKDG